MEAWPVLPPEAAAARPLCKRSGLEVVRVLLGPGMLVDSSAGAAFQTVVVRFVIYGEGVAHMRVPAAEKSSEYSGNRIA